MSHELSCEACQAMLPWYINGQLTNDERAAMAMHLETCQECQQELRQWQTTRQAVTHFFNDVVQPPPNGLSRLVANTRRFVSDLPTPNHINNGRKHMTQSPISDAPQQPQNTTPHDSHRSGRTSASYIAIFLLGALVVVLLGVGAHHFVQSPGASSIHTKSIIVPNYVGEQVAIAQADVITKHLVLVAVYVTSDQPKGQIISQNPAAGIPVALNSQIQVAVSAGSGNVLVPDVIGDTVDAACQAITQAGLVCNNAQIADSTSTLPAGLVSRTDPPKQTSIRSGSLVTLYVSLGQPTATPTH